MSECTRRGLYWKKVTRSDFVKKNDFYQRIFPLYVTCLMQDVSRARRATVAMEAKKRLWRKLMFTCTADKLWPDLTESSFLQAFRRFSSRRSLPVVMISDNASTYLASAETLQELFQSRSLKEVFGRQGITGSLFPSVLPGMVDSGND